jgi:hypothetical protein
VLLCLHSDGDPFEGGKQQPNACPPPPPHQAIWHRIRGLGSAAALPRKQFALILACQYAAHSSVRGSSRDLTQLATTGRNPALHDRLSTPTQSSKYPRALLFYPALRPPVDKPFENPMSVLLIDALES